jgi:hypothetical protein
MSAKANRIAIAELRAKLGNTPEPVDPWAFVPLYLIAFHLGGWKPDTKHSVAEHYCKGAEWSSGMAMADALHRDPATFNEHQHAAMVRMFAARGVDLDTASAEANSKLMFELISEAEKAGCPLGLGGEMSDAA